jgi:tryptophan-rich sensory protein
MNSANYQIDRRPVDNSWARILAPVLAILFVSVPIAGYVVYRQVEAKQARIDAACNQYEMNVAKVRLNPYMGDSSELERPYFCPAESIGGKQ